jgi:HEAT repeat protein
MTNVMDVPPVVAKRHLSCDVAIVGGGTAGTMAAITAAECGASVLLIRDCAELATRASLAREESRWGLYHDRPDHPDRDDAEWFWHLNIRRAADGTPELVKRTVAPYIVPVAEFHVPERDVTEVVISDAAPPGADDGQPIGRRTAANPSPIGRPPRLLDLLRLAETQPTVSQLDSYTRDPDPRVRRAVIAVLTESAPVGVGPALAEATADANGTVRHAATAGLRELVALLPAQDEELLAALRAALASPDPVVRCAILDVLRELRAGAGPIFAAAMADPDHRVRLCAVKGLVSTGETNLVAGASVDRSREVRVAVAEGLAILGATHAEGRIPEIAWQAGPDGTGDPSQAESPIPEGDLRAGTDEDLRRALELLADDRDPLVRAAAFKAAGAVGCPPPLDAIAARALAAGPDADSAWQARAGAAHALAAAPPQLAVAPLASAAADPHPEVRKAAVMALAAMRAHPAAAVALQVVAAADGDADADVRAYARSAESMAGVGGTRVRSGE